MALGLQRRHVYGGSASVNVLSAEFSGPSPEAVVASYRDTLVAVFAGKQSTHNLPFVRRQTTNNANKNACESIESVLADMHCLVGEQLVVCFRSSAGKQGFE